MNLAVTILIGLAVGAMVELILPGHDPAELFLAMLLGIIGALLARLFGAGWDWFEPGEPASFVSSILGAIIVLSIYGLLFRRRRPN